MILSDGEIYNLLENKSLQIEPLEKKQIQPASVDFLFCNTFCIAEDSYKGIIRLKDEIEYKTIVTDKYLLLPGQFVLATTIEYLKLFGNLTAFVEWCGSLGCLGLFIQNAGWVDPGFEVESTIELFNANRCAIELQTGYRIGQIVFAKMDERAIYPYSGKYQKQKCATGSKAYIDFRGDKI